MDYSQYHPDWRDVIRPQILKRDQYKCKVCGVKHKSTVYKTTNGAYIECDDFMQEWAISQGKKVFTLYLQIAHLNHDKSDNDPSNLQALCPIHHARHDKEHKKFQRIIFKQKIKDNQSQIKAKKISARKQYIDHIKSMVYQYTRVKIDISAAEHILNQCLQYIDKLNK